MEPSTVEETLKGRPESGSRVVDVPTFRSCELPSTSVPYKLFLADHRLFYPSLGPNRLSCRHSSYSERLLNSSLSAHLTPSSMLSCDEGTLRIAVTQPHFSPRSEYDGRPLTLFSTSDYTEMTRAGPARIRPRCGHLRRVLLSFPSPSSDTSFFYLLEALSSDEFNESCNGG